MTRAEDPLAVRVSRHLHDLGIGVEPAHLLVALSGGLDSVVLLHLLRFQLPGLPLRLTAAHLDHAMRAESAADADWVAELCVAWGVPLRRDRLRSAPAGETEAREARHAFLRREAHASGADLIATAHHADDQAETVLFRALRGTGLRGLAGMSALGGGIVRPLLPFWRRELAEYARRQGIEYREDASNAGLDAARNRLRNQILPLLEMEVAPAAREKLVSLAALAAEAEGALDRLANAAESELVRWEGEEAVLARDRLRIYDSAVASRVVRNVLRRFGVVPGRAGTRGALQFITHAPSGRGIPLPEGILISIEFDRARIFRPGSVAGDVEARIEGLEPREGVPLRIGGVGYRLRTGADAGGGGWSLPLSREGVALPLLVRGWRPGDWMRTGAGRKNLKQVFLEQRVPRRERSRLPVVVDGRGEVLWVAGVARGRTSAPLPGEEPFILTVSHD